MTKTFKLILLLTIGHFLFSCTSSSSKTGKLLEGIWERFKDVDWGPKIMEFKNDGTYYINGDMAGSWEIASSVSKDRSAKVYLIVRHESSYIDFYEIREIDDFHLSLSSNGRTEIKYIRH